MDFDIQEDLKQEIQSLKSQIYKLEDQLKLSRRAYLNQVELAEILQHRIERHMNCILSMAD